MGRAWKGKDSEYYRQLAVKFRQQSLAGIVLEDRQEAEELAGIYEQLADKVEQCERYLRAMDWPDIKSWPFVNIKEDGHDPQ